MGILYNGYCYADMSAVQDMMTSGAIAEFFDSRGAYLVTLTANSYTGNTITLNVLSRVVSSTTSFASVGTITKTLPTCSVVGPFPDFSISQIDQTAVVSAFTAGASIVFPAFAIAWGAAFVINSIRGKRG